MRTTLQAINAHPKLQLQLAVTGMHLQARHGLSLRQIERDGWLIDAIVPWKPAGETGSQLASATGQAMAKLAGAYEKLKTDIVLVVGDRVEAFAAASAGHVSGKIVAHIHGGDRAPGQIDDALRHAITKLSHLHFPATSNSASRLLKLGEEAWRIHEVGSPGIDGIEKAAETWKELHARWPQLQRSQFALLLLHPIAADAALEQNRCAMTFRALRKAGISQIVAIYPNNDPGSAGIIAQIRMSQNADMIVLKDAPRGAFLGLLKECVMLVGNSSSGIIEAASFGTPVINIGPRQLGRDRSQNVTDVPYAQSLITKAAARIWNKARPKRFADVNLYGGNGTGKRIAAILAKIRLDERLGRKLISY